jgi:hypothetical protein
MKKVFSAACLLLISYVCFCQAQPGTVTVQKDILPAAVLQLPYPPALVSDALESYLSKKGRSKGTDLNGFTTFRNTQPSTSAAGNADMFFKIERKSRQEKSITIVSLLLTTPTEGDAQSTALQYMNMNEARVYLDNLVPAIVAYQLEEQIKDQNAQVSKAESRYRSLKSDETDMERKRTKLEKDIAENKLQISAQDAEVNLQKQTLATLVSQRKN